MRLQPRCARQWLLLALLAACACGAVAGHEHAVVTVETSTELFQALKKAASERGRPITLQLASSVVLEPRDALPRPVRLQHGTKLSIRGANGRLQRLDLGGIAQLLVVPAGSSLALHGLHITGGAQPEQVRGGLHVGGFALWPIITLEPGATVELSDVSIEVRGSGLCAQQQLPAAAAALGGGSDAVPAEGGAVRRAALEILSLPVVDAASGRQVGVVAMAASNVRITCLPALEGPSAGRERVGARALAQAPMAGAASRAEVRNASTSLELMIALNSGLGLDTGSTTAIQLLGDIDLQEADTKSSSLPLEVAAGKTLLLFGAPGPPKALDLSGLEQPRLIYLQPYSTGVFSNLNISGTDDRVGLEGLPPKNSALPTWPRISGAPNSTVVFQGSSIRVVNAACTPEFVAAQVEFLRRQPGFSPGALEQVGNTTAILFHSSTAPVPIFDLNNAQIGTLNFTLQNTTIWCVQQAAAEPPPASSSSDSSDSSSSFPVAAVAVPVAVVVAAAAAVGGFFLWRRRQRSRQAAEKGPSSSNGVLPVIPEAAPSSHGHSASDSPRPREPAGSGSGGSTPPHPGRSAAELQDGVLKSRVGFIDGLVLGGALGGGGYGRVWLGHWRGAAVAVKVVSATVAPGQEVDLSREPLLSVALQHPSVLTSYKTCVVRILSAEGQPPGDALAAAAATGGAAAAAGGGLSRSGSLPTGGSVRSTTGGRVARSITDRNAMVEVMPTDAVLEPGMYETWIVSEYCDRGSLGEAIDKGLFKSDKPPGWHLEAILRCLLDIARGLEYLHGCNCMHGDLKPANCLLKTEMRDVRGYVVKVADFGLSRVCSAMETHVETGSYGTATHAAPERIVDGRLTFASDIYAFGCIMWEMLSGERMFKHTPVLQVIHRITQGYHPPIPPGCPEQLADLMQRCWQADPRARPDAAGVIDALIRFAASLRASRKNSREAAPAASPAAAQAAAAPAEDPPAA